MFTDTTDAPAVEECGACHRTFPTLAEVFSHPCDGLPAHLLGSAKRHATTRGDNLDAPERHDGPAATPTPKPDRSNRYAGDCVRCHTRVDANAGLLVRNHAGGHGTSWGVEHRTGQCPTTTPDPVPEPTAPAGARRNRFAGPCRICQHDVPANAGLLRNVDGRWVVEHDGGCRTDGPPAPAFTPEKGAVHVIDGDYYRVHMAQGTGRVYTVRWTGTEWVYATGGAHRLTADNVATAEDAARFGELFHRCVFCTRDLDTPESTEVGYGPVCAAKRGLPWG